jgi:hypothetical protein
MTRPKCCKAFGPGLIFSSEQNWKPIDGAAAAAAAASKQVARLLRGLETFQTIFLLPQINSSWLSSKEDMESLLKRFERLKGTKTFGIFFEILKKNDKTFFIFILKNIF